MATREERWREAGRLIEDAIPRGPGGVKAESVAVSLGMSRQHLYRVFSGQTPLKLEGLIKLAGLVRIDVPKLLDLYGYPPPNEIRTAIRDRPDLSGIERDVSEADRSFKAGNPSTALGILESVRPLLGRVKHPGGRERELEFIVIDRQLKILSSTLTGPDLWEATARGRQDLLDLVQGIGARESSTGDRFKDRARYRLADITKAGWLAGQYPDASQQLARAATSLKDPAAKAKALASLIVVNSDVRSIRDSQPFTRVLSILERSFGRLVDRLPRDDGANIGEEIARALGYRTDIPKNVRAFATRYLEQAYAFDPPDKNIRIRLDRARLHLVEAQLIEQDPEETAKDWRKIRDFAREIGSRKLDAEALRGFRDASRRVRR